MGRFELDFKDFESYQDGEYYKKTVPNALCDSLANFFVNACGEQDCPETVPKLASVVDDLYLMAGKDNTSNWDAGILRTEVATAFHILRELRFDRFMDGTRKAVDRLYSGLPLDSRDDYLLKVNGVFNDNNFGYLLRPISDQPNELMWEARWKNETVVAVLTLATESLENLCPETLDRIQQAKDHLHRFEDQRSRKDSIRDVMSAMEAMLMKLAGEKDIKIATRKLKEKKSWGNDKIVKDGLSIWNDLHRLYPDIRHGQPTCNEIDLDETVYWIGRIAVYIKYMADRKKTIGR